MNNEVLHIIDVSPAIYSGLKHFGQIQGSVHLKGNLYSQDLLDAGGICYIYNFIEKYQSLFYSTDAIYNRLIFVFDSEPTIKKTINANYKANRKHNENVRKQKDLAEYILRKIGFPIFKKDGYEADDLIYSLCRKYKDRVKQIYVYTNDSDLSINVDKNVTIKPINKRAKEITLDNYSTTVADNYIEYNSIALYKSLYGDKSDNILPANIRNPNFIYNHYTTGVIKDKLGMTEVMVKIIEYEFPTILDNVKLVYPLIDDNITLDLDTIPDIIKIKEYARVIGSNAFNSQYDKNIIDSLSYEILSAFGY